MLQRTAVLFCHFSPANVEAAKETFLHAFQGALERSKGDDPAMRRLLYAWVRQDAELELVMFRLALRLRARLERRAHPGLLRGRHRRAGLVLQRTGGRSVVAGDPELMAFVRDRAGRLALDDLLAACRSAFPDRRLPSRSGLHRFLALERAKAS